MPTVRRRRTIAAGAHAVWSTVADPQALARWWPRVERVEAVDGPLFTEVMRTSSGRPVRLDFAYGLRRAGEELCWAQQLEGTPFERYFAESRITVRLADAGGGSTEVTIELRQRAKGTARLGAPLLRRAARKQVTEALDGLERLFGP